MRSRKTTIGGKYGYSDGLLGRMAFNWKSVEIHEHKPRLVILDVFHLFRLIRTVFQEWQCQTLQFGTKEFMAIAQDLQFDQDDPFTQGWSFVLRCPLLGYYPCKTIVLIFYWIRVVMIGNWSISSRFAKHLELYNGLMYPDTQLLVVSSLYHS